MNLFNTLIALVCLSSVVHGQSTLVWEFKAKAGVYSSPVADDNFIYIGSNDSYLYALDKGNGELRWKFKTEGEIRSRPLVYDGTIIFNSSDGSIYCVNSESGAKKWIFKTEGEKRYDIWDYYLSSPVYHNGKVLIGSGDGNVYAINPNSGESIWKYKTGDVVHATPLVYDDKVYVGSFDGSFYALNFDTGDLIWRFNTVGDAYFPKGEVQKGAARYGNSVIFGCRDYNIYALNVETGTGVWNMKEKGSWVIATPLVYNDVVYFGTSDSHRFCGLQAENGYEKWSVPLNMRVYGEAISDEDRIVFGCFNGKLYQFNPNNGEARSIFQTHGSKSNYFEVFNENDEFKEGFELYGEDMLASEEKILSLGAILSTPLIDEGIVYFGDSNGVIYALEL